MKKLLSIAIAATIGLSMPLFSACGEGGKGPKDTIPEYSEDKTFLIGGWNDPPKTDWSNFDYVKEAGLDFFFIPIITTVWERRIISSASNIWKKSA